MEHIIYVASGSFDSKVGLPDRQTETDGQADAGQSDPYKSLWLVQAI